MCNSLIFDLKQHGFRRQHREEKHVEQGEDRKVMQGLSTVVSGVFAEGDETCQRGNERARAADVNAHQQLTKIVGELREQNGGWHVTDELTGQNADKKCTFAQQEVKQVLNHF